MSKGQLNPEKWVDRYGDYLYNYTLSRIDDRDIAQDLISETFLAALHSRDNFKGEATERTWLVSILKRKIIDLYRMTNSKKGRAEVKVGTVWDDDKADWLENRVMDQHSNSGDRVIQNEELGEALSRCLEGLEERQRAIFMRKTIDQYDTQAICKEFDISTSNLWVIIHRARKAMVGCMEKTWFS
jgi:RNA polymerase sigma-70 factor (ECF subfamily)